jgi:hypothetical protein
MAANPWWVIIATNYGSAPSYEYFQGTQAQAELKSRATVEVSTQQNLYGPYSTKAAAQAAVARGLTAPTPGGGGLLPDPPGIGTPPSGGASNPASDLEDIGHFLSDLTSRNLWLRVSKLVVGVALIIVGVIELTGAGKVITTVAKDAI